MKKIITILFLCLPALLQAQQISFQKVLQPSAGVGDLQSFDAVQTKDGGYICTGIGKFGASVYRPILMKLNCKGASVWAKNFGSSSTIGNIMMKVIETKDGGYCMLNNIGQYGSYNILVVRTDKNGNTLWRKIINAGAGNDVGQCLQQTKDGGFIIVGSTNSFGTETIGGSYADVYAVHLDANGATVWSKTIGNVSNIDEATAVVQTKDGGFAITGRYITQGAFFAMLLKLDNSGAVQLIKTFGDTNHSNYGLAICEASNGDLVFCGSTTLLQNSYQDYADHFVIRCNALGDTLWTKAYYGTLPNSFENPSSIFEEKNGDLIVGANTASYPTMGFVPNKQMVMRIGNDGALKKAIIYNNGSSHYARCSAAIDDGYFISGFTTLYNVTTFQTNLIKTPTNLFDVCNTTDVTNATVTVPVPFKVYTPTFSINTGCANINNNTENTFNVLDTTICNFYPSIASAFTTSNSCANSPITFTSSTVASVGYVWYFGNGDSAISALPTTTYSYPIAGTYTVTLIVSNGCDKDTSTKVIQVTTPPVLTIMQNPDPAKEGDIITLSTNLNPQQFLWSTGNTSPSIVVTQAGIYYVTATINGCVLSDTISVAIQPIGINGWVKIPTAFTPNNDGYQDFLNYIIKGGYVFKTIRIYNRLGNCVFESDEATKLWDGKYNGNHVANDVYYYVAKFTIGGKEEMYKGDVMVIR
jgi:gliding motility-associated-like protein